MPKDLKSLQDVIDSVPNFVSHLYNDVVPWHARPSPWRTPVPQEFSNWRDEQRAWRETAVLFDQSHHMPELFIEGPDAAKLLNQIGVNSFDKFRPGKAKQFIGCNERGMVIGDCVLHMLGDDHYELVSGWPLLNWVQFQAEKGGYKVKIKRDHNTADNPTSKRINFRFGMDGPNAGAIFDKVVEGEAPNIAFFNTAKVRIAGVEVMALRHGMAGHRGVEMSGPYEQMDDVLNAILEAGKEFGLRRGGTRAYFSSAIESGWMGYPLPAIYTGDDMREFREWLPAHSFEADFQMGGSYVSDNIEDYYYSPYDLGYDAIIKFDHDFIGRAALEEMAKKPRRRRVSLVWNDEDVARIQQSYLEPGDPFRYLDRPIADYVMNQADELRTPDGKFVGIAQASAYSFNERKQLSMATVATEYAEPGVELILTWGEPDGGSRKPRVERHRQTSVRVTTAGVPYAKYAADMMRAGLTQSNS